MIRHTEVAALGGQGEAVSDTLFPIVEKIYAVTTPSDLRADQTGDVTTERVMSMVRVWF